MEHPRSFRIRHGGLRIAKREFGWRGSDNNTDTNVQHQTTHIYLPLWEGTVLICCLSHSDGSIEYEAHASKGVYTRERDQNDHSATQTKLTGLVSYRHTLSSVEPL